MALINGRRLNVGVHTLTKGYFLKYSGDDLAGPVDDAVVTAAFLFLPPILYIIYYNIIVYVVYTRFTHPSF